MPAEKFVLDDWRESANDDDSNEALLHGCGTTGYAVGWACALSEFIAQCLNWSSAMARSVYSHGVEQLISVLVDAQNSGSHEEARVSALADLSTMGAP